MKHDKSKLTLQPHTYGARPFRPFHLTPYATVNVILGNEAAQEHILPHIAVSNSNHLGQDASRHSIAQENNFPEELPDYIRIVHEKHSNIWRKDVEKAVTRLTKIHVQRMAEYASDLFAACKNNTTTPHGPLPPSASTPIFSPPRASTSIAGAPRDEEPVLVGEDVHGSQFWEEATRIAAEIEQSAGKKTHMTDPSSTANARTEHQDITEPTTELRPINDIECPTFNLLPEGETWTQHFAANNHPSPRGVANIATSTGGTSKDTSGAATIETHLSDVAKPNAPEPATEEQLIAHTVSSQADATDNTASEAPCVDVPKFTSPGTQDSNQAPNAECGQSPSTVECTIGTQTQDKKNRKKRAFLDRNNEAQQKKLKNLKVTDKSKDAYDTYILRRCIRKPVDNEKRPPFVDFGEYHVTYEEFREAFKPRGCIDKNVMELFIRDFNLVTNNHTTSEPLCTKFAFSQSLTTKLMVHEDKFDPKTCITEFQKVYRDHQLKSKDMLYFAIVDTKHWVLVCINLLLKQVNVLDSMIGVKKTRCYDRADFLVNNFIKLASFANAFPKTNFGQFVQNNPQELRQQTTTFDCGVFVMMFMTQWDGKIMKPFDQDLIQLRMLISYKILTSSLNKVDPTWVLKKKK
nr:uncharacterized protein LOC127299605 [Lolium perenne]